MTFASRQRSAWWALALSAVGAATGCTSALTSAYLRGMPWEGPEHAAETAVSTATDDTPTTGAEGDPAGNPAAEADDERRAAAIDEAVSRLTRIGALDESAAAALVATLETTQQEDWPVVIAEFAAALGPPASRRSEDAEVGFSAASAEASPADGLQAGGEARSSTADAAALPHVVAKAELTPSTPPAEPTNPQGIRPRDVEAEETPSGLDATRPLAGGGPMVGPPPRDDAESAAAAVTPDVGDGVPPPVDGVPAPDRVLKIANACFASRVQAWGVVDRFPQDRFRPGREVIVYFELANLSAQVTSAGHTTCIDTVLRLVDASGRTVQEWDFEPIAETCAGRRNDYFARYVVRIPQGAAPGDCRLELRVVDTLASTETATELPLRILAPSGNDAG